MPISKTRFDAFSPDGRTSRSSWTGARVSGVRPNSRLASRGAAPIGEGRRKSLSKCSLSKAPLGRGCSTKLEDFPRFDLGLHLIVRGGVCSLALFLDSEILRTGA